MTPLRPSSNGGSDSGAPFAEQLDGLTAATPGAGAWRSVAAVKLQKKSGDDTPAPQTVATPAATQPMLAFQIQLPADSNIEPLGPQVNKKAPALAGASQTTKQPLPDDAAPVPGSDSKVSGQSQGQGAPHEGALAAKDAPAAPITQTPVPAPQQSVVVPINEGQSIAVKAAVSRSQPGDGPEPASQTDITAAAGSGQRPQELAFAVRVQPVQSAAHTTLPAEMAATAAVASASKKATADENGLPADSHALLPATIAAPEHNAASASSHAAPEAAPGTQQADASTPLAESLPKATAPLKDITLQVTQPGKEPVDVRVVQQGSEVHVSVHSGDAGLTSGLRQGLSELQGRLEENGYRSEMWRPTASASPLTPTPSSQASTNQSRGGDPQPQQGGSQQDSGRRNPNQSNQPRWVEEMESSLTGGPNSSGGFHGFSS
jgi:hypothetical protein